MRGIINHSVFMAGAFEVVSVWRTGGVSTIDRDERLMSPVSA
jgi:hypothetical protein